MTKKEHTAQADFHSRMAEHHAKVGDAHEALATASESEKHAEAHTNISTCHKEMSAAHEGEAQRHVDCCKASDDSLEKDGGGELAEVLRDLKKFLGNVVQPLPAGVSMIPRYNARDPRAEKDAVSKIAPELRHVISDPTEAAPSSVEWTSPAR